MTPLTAFFIYLLIWWTLLFTVLPIGVKGHNENGAPEKANMKKKLILNTVLSFVVLGIIQLLVMTGVIEWRKAFADEPMITKKDCDYLVAYQPAKGVEGADYVPGVDARGKPVVEADLTPSVVTAPETYTFDINIDVAQYIGLATPAGVEAKTKVGSVVVDKAGHITYNGKPLEGDAEAALRALCVQQEKH